jgi:tRNA(fMet)-specific endonuclease VapC
MRLYVLDTDIMSLLQHGHAQVCGQVQTHPASQLATTVITVEEQLSGWYTMLRQAKGRAQVADLYERLANQVQFLASWRVLRFPEPAILRYEDLLHLRLNLGKKDLRIAAIVLEHQAILVSRNARDFRRVPGLVLEDWSV